MRHLLTRLMLGGAVAAAAVALPFAAPASASAITCSSVIGSTGLVATVCTDILNDQVKGRLTPLASGVIIDSLTLYTCNAAETSCTALATTTTLMTPVFPVTSGKHYETCARFHVRESLTTVRYYSGCSPFNVAPA
jgi:hypothetical protein